MTSTTCPHCNADLRGSPILPEHQEHYGGETHYSRAVGIEVRGVYDGVLFWQCPDCHGTWHRFPEDHWLRHRAVPYITAPT